MFFFWFLFSIFSWFCFGLGFSVQVFKGGSCSTGRVGIADNRSGNRRLLRSGVTGGACRPLLYICVKHSLLQRDALN